MQNLCSGNGWQKYSKSKDGVVQMEAQTTNRFKKGAKIMKLNPPFSLFVRSCAAGNIFSGPLLVLLRFASKLIVWGTMLTPLIRLCLHLGRFGHIYCSILFHFGTLLTQLAFSFGTPPTQHLRQDADRRHRYKIEWYSISIKWNDKLRINQAKIYETRRYWETQKLVSSVPSY